MTDTLTGLDPALEAHLRKIWSPAHVAIAASGGEWRPAKHLLYLNKELLRAAMDPEQSFLNIQASVRHGKSELCTIWNVVWFLGVFPKARVAIVCGNEDLAKRFSRKARDLFKVWGPLLFGKTLRADLTAADEWGVSDGGTVRAVGVGGQLSGDGFDLIIIDDPIVKAEEARSETNKTNMMEWYGFDCRSRLMPGGTMILTMARWTDDDISARIVEQAQSSIDKGEDADPWIVIKMPAIAEAPRGEDPDTWVDMLGRREGDVLWPELWPLKTLIRRKNSLLDPRSWDANYQQNPVPRTGNLFDWEKWGRPTLTREQLNDRVTMWVRAWDLAGTKKAGDFTVGTLIGKYDDGHRSVIADVIRLRGTPDEVEQMIVNTATTDGPGVKVWLETPKGDSGVTGHHYSKLLPHRDFHPEPVSGDKEDRADLLASAQRRGFIDLVETGPVAWIDEFMREFERFPNGRHDDQIDASSLGYNAIWDFGNVVMVLPDASTSVTLNRVDPSTLQQTSDALEVPSEEQEFLASQGFLTQLTTW